MMILTTSPTLSNTENQATTTNTTTNKKQHYASDKKFLYSQLMNISLKVFITVYLALFLKTPLLALIIVGLCAHSTVFKIKTPL